MNQLGKNLVLSLCIVATLLVILGVKRKFGRDEEATLLLQPTQGDPRHRQASSKGVPRPRVLQAEPVTQHDRAIVSPTSPGYNSPAADFTPNIGRPISPLPNPTAERLPAAPSGGSPVFVPFDEPVPSPAAGRIVDGSPEATPEVVMPMVPVANRPLPELVVTGPEDSFWSIAEQVYGSGTYYRALFRHNESKVLRPDQLQAGIEIRTPPLEVLRELYPADCPAAPSPAP